MKSLHSVLGYPRNDAHIGFEISPSHCQLSDHFIKHHYFCVPLEIRSSWILKVDFLHCQWPMRYSESLSQMNGTLIFNPTYWHLYLKLHLAASQGVNAAHLVIGGSVLWDFWEDSLKGGSPSIPPVFHPAAWHVSLMAVAHSHLRQEYQGHTLGMLQQSF